MPQRYIHVVNCFSKGEKYRLHEMLNLCCINNSFVCGVELGQKPYKGHVKCCIPAASSSSCYFVRSHINAHQRRISKLHLNAFENRMTNLNFSKNFKDFEDLYDYVSCNSNLRNRNCLLVYDFCLRKGYQLGVRPQKYVYLFCGAKEGAQYILGKIKGYKLPTSLFQAILGTSLSSMEIEHLLCTCKEHLFQLGTLDKTLRNRIICKVIAGFIQKDYNYLEKECIDIALEIFLLLLDEMNELDNVERLYLLYRTRINQNLSLD